MHHLWPPVTNLSWNKRQIPAKRSENDIFVHRNAKSSVDFFAKRPHSWLLICIVMNNLLRQFIIKNKQKKHHGVSCRNVVEACGQAFCYIVLLRKVSKLGHGWCIRTFQQVIVFSLLVLIPLNIIYVDKALSLCSHKYRLCHVKQGIWSLVIRLQHHATCTGFSVAFAGPFFQ